MQEAALYHTIQRNTHTKICNFQLIGLDKWGEVCHSPVCNSGQSQSPIDLSNPDKIHSLETGVKFIDYHQMTEFNVSNTWRLTKNHVLSSKNI